MTRKMSRRNRKSCARNLERSHNELVNQWLQELVKNSEANYKLWQARDRLEDFTALEEIHENW